MKEIIHFAHGNGFPSTCYQQLLLPLRSQFNCIEIDRIGHDNDFPVTENWPFLIQEMILSVEKQATQPVIALGHSLGGVLSFLAAIERPELFKRVILLDSPLINPIKSCLVHLAKQSSLIDYVTPAMRTRGRRRHWKTRQEVITYLKSRSLFSGFTAACLNDYVDFGLIKDAKGYSLRFDPEIEYQIYRTIPHDLNRLRGKQQVPTTLIYGQQSKVVSRFDRYYMQYGYQVRCIPINGSHMFPMEFPDLVATQVATIIQE